jgi:putative ABC transport system permease protein
VGEKFKPVHGSAAERGEEHSPFDVVGVLAQTGTPNDRAIFVNMEGFYHLHTASAEDADQGGAAAHGETKTEAKADAKSAAKKEPAGHAKAGAEKKESHGSGGEAHAAHDHDEIPDEKKQVTAVLVGINPNMIATRRVALPKFMSKVLEVQAVAPSEQIDRLLVGIVGNIQWILLILAVMIVIVAGIGIMVSIYNSMSDRRHEIAVIRALGARRTTVMVVVLLESILLALGGGAIGLLLGHGLTGLLAPLIADQTGVSVNPLQFQLSELILIPGLIVLASMVGYLPAVVAYRTDVAQSLVSSP